MEKISILQCQVIAKKLGFDKIEFLLCGPKGEKKAKWLDAHLGLFQLEGEKEVEDTLKLIDLAVKACGG